MRSSIVFLIAFCLLSIGCVQQRQKTETKKCSAIPMDTSLVVVDSILLLYSKLKTSDKEIHAILEERPEYPGGMDEVVKYIQTHIQYPPTAVYKKIEGKVWIESVINRDGKVVQPKVAYSVHPLLDQEALRIIKMMPDWKPGKLNGETVKVKYVFPVTFRIEDHIVLVDEGPKRNPNDTGAVEIEYIPPVNFDSVIKKSLEPATTENFTQKQLKEILNVIDSKRDKLTDECLKSNLISWGMDSHHIHVTFIMNTPEARKAFREKIIDSPAVIFEGPTEKAPNNSMGVSDTLGILLQSDYPVFSTQSKQATFVLVNHSKVTLRSGAYYFLTYEDERGVWRDLPIHGSFLAIGYIIEPGRTRHLSGSLYPEIHHNKPGRYRFFYPVTFTDTGRKATLMAEFKLTDNPQELAEGQKEKRLAVPSTQDNRSAGTITTSVPEVPTDDNHLFQVVECMPEFPGGMKGCMDFIQKEMRYPEEAKIQGRVHLQFIIEKDGTPAQPRIVRSVHPLLDKEALRIIRQMPKWTPGKQDGRPQRVLYPISIQFRLPKP